MPYVSAAQRGYFHANRAKLEAQGVSVSEWDHASKGMKLPYKANRGGVIQSALRTAKKYAEGGEVDEWESIPKSPEGRPQITVTKPPDLISQYAKKAADWFGQPSQIKPETPPAPEFNAAPDQSIGNAVRGVGAGMIQHYKDLADPFAKNEEGKYVADQPIPENPGKIPEALKSDRATPILGEVASTFAGPPGSGLGWGLLKAGAAGMAGAAAKAGLKSAARQGFMDTAHFKSIGLSKGTMPGGFKVDPATGAEWYVKQAPNLEQAKNEKLTAELYKLFGVPVADVHLTTVGGKPGIASRKIEGQQLSQVETPYHEIQDLHENYPIHALLANHDAVGTGPENPLGNIIVDKNGRAHVIDTGGGLTYKGTGSKKAEFTPEVPELDTMRDPQYSHLSAQVFGGVDHQSALAGAQKIANVSAVDIAKLVELYGPSSKMEKLNLMSTLLKRKHNIETEFGVVPGESTAYTSPNLETAKAPRPDPYEQIPFTEEDYNNFGKEIPPPLPDDVRPPKQAAAPEPTTLLGSSGPIAQKLMSGKKLDKTSVAAMTKFLTGEGAWNSAHFLWEIADSVNPQVAEALFRALPPKIQVDVGHRIAALKDSLEYSPFNSIAKGSGKDGKYPSEYDFYTTQTTAFKPPASVLKDKKFIDELDQYAAKIEGKEPEVPQAVADKGYEPIHGGYGNSWLNAPKEAHKLLEHFKTGPNEMVQDYNTKGIGTEIAKIAQEYPTYADHIYFKIPEHLKQAVTKAYGNAKAELQAAKTAKLEEKAKVGDFTKEEGKTAAVNHDNSPIGIEYIRQNILKPIPDWKNWIPPNKNATKPSFPNEFQKALAEKTGHNTNFEIHKGGSYDPHPEHWDYPSTIPDPAKKKYERAWYSSDAAEESHTYGGIQGGSYIARADKAFEFHWKDLTGMNGYQGTAMHNAVEAGRKAGADIIAIHGMVDQSGVVHTQYAVINPAILRAPKAKFALKDMHKSWPLAGVAGGALYTFGQPSDEGKDKMNRGGIPALLHKAKKMARGGSDISGGYHPRHPAGMIKSSIPGRTDKIPMGVPPGSYVLPADFVSALGQNNSMSGEKIIGKMFNSGPYSPGSTGQLSGKLKTARQPKPPRLHLGKFAAGGETEQDGQEDVPIIAAGGEVILHPDQVRNVGHGDLSAGHRVLDSLVLKVRKEHIRTLQSLKPPKK